MFIFSLIAFTFIGLGAGFLAGLLGISGGILTVPFLLLTFKLLHFPNIHLMQLAIGTSLAGMVFNAISATYSHHKAGGVQWTMVRKMVPGLIIGCVVGAFIGYLLPGAILQIVFGIFAMFLGIYFYQLKGSPSVKSTRQPSGKALNTYGFLVSSISNILGIGGGTMMVPVFLHFKTSMKTAVGSAAATGFLISLAGALSYLYFGYGETYFDYTVGYIYIPAFVILSITTFFTAPAGAKLAQKLPGDKLKRYFSVALIALGVFMLIR